MNNYNDSWVKYYDQIYPKEKYEKEVEFLLSFFEKDKIKKIDVLDIGCGTGNHSILLSEKVNYVEGLEPCKDMYEIASKKENKKCQFDNMFLNQSAKEKYDLIISMFNVINHIQNIKDLQDFFKDVKKRIKKNGYFIFDCWNYIATFLDVPKNNEKIIDNIHLFCNPEMNLLDSTINLCYTLIDTRERRTINYNIVSYMWQTNILKQLLQLTGFKIENVCVAYDKNIMATEKDYKIVFICRG